MRHYSVAILLVIGLLPGIGMICGLQAQEQGMFTDFRERSGYTEEDLARSLFQPPPSDVRMRGIGPTQAQPAPTSGTTSKNSIALNVFFEFNSDRILQNYYSDLDKLGKVLTDPQYAAYRVQIEGYTDSIGSDSYNRRLSERRAESVKHYLIQHFPIRSDRLVARGFGKSKPIAPNDTAEGRDKNRRVEVVNLGSN